MPPDGEKQAACLAWFKKAELDLQAAAHDLQAAEPFTGSSVFHSQQAVEKAIKGFLFFSDRPFRKTHSIRELAAEVADVTLEHADLLAEAGELTPYATVFRYPGEEDEPPLSEAVRALALAKRVVEALRRASVGASG